METLDIESANEQKMQRISDLLEELLLDTALSVLYKLSEYRQGREITAICYKSSCPSRDQIPF
jgi:hypothetical protein